MSSIIYVVAYLRYSSDNQRQESIEAQLKAIKEYCEKKGYILVDVYIDEEKSATTDQRPKFQQMISDSEFGKFRIVLVHKMDRFARNRYDSAFYKRKLKLNGVRLESVLEQFDDSPESIILESVIEGMNEYYSKNLSRETRKGMLMNAEKGLYNGGRPAYGLKINPETKQYEIDERRYKAVQMYFEGIDADLSLEEIARRINAAGFKTSKGQKFTGRSFTGWAHNRKYKGDYTWDVTVAKDEEGKRNSHAKKPKEKQIIIPGVIPAIIDDELWERVNKKMKERQNSGGRMKAKAVYLLTGKVVCGECGKPYNGDSYTSKNNQYNYYKCAGRCGNKRFKKDDLEEIVVDQLINTCFTPTAMMDIAQEVKRMYNERHNNIDHEIEPIKNEIKELEAKVDNWIEAIGEGLLDKKMLACKIREANEKKAFLETQLVRAKTIKSSKTISESAIIKLLENKKFLLTSDNEEAKKEVIQEYVDSVIITQNGTNGGLDVKLTVRVFNGGGEPCHRLVIRCPVDNA